MLSGIAIVVASIFVPKHEGRNLTAYYDPIGKPTICEGWTHGVKIGDVATEEECDIKTLKGLQQAWQTFVDNVPDTVIATMTPFSIAAFLSFIYNVGSGKKGVKDGFVTLKTGRQSTMLTKLKSGDVIGACHELPNWTLAGGKKFKGLVIRRAEELKICIKGLV